MQSPSVLLAVYPLVVFVAICLFIIVVQQRRKRDLETRLRDAGPVRRFFRGPFGLPVVLIGIWVLLSLIDFIRTLL
jgi:hypothetical protein